MIEIPQVGFQRSASKSNVKTDVMADWLEANVLFDQPRVTKSDVVDMLIEYQICPDGKQDLANHIAGEGWDEVARRKQWGGLPLSVSISGTSLEAQESWEASPIWSFLVLLSNIRHFPDWAKAHQSYFEQGNLFEKVVEEVCPAILPGWTFYRVGWAPDNTKNIRAIVDELCRRLYVSGATDLNDWINPAEKDGGLDIVCYREFEDERETLPVFFLQCASGKNWRKKVNTPNPSSWQKYLNSAVQPSTGIVAPFVIEPMELKRSALSGQVVVFDRLRVLSAARTKGITLNDDLLENLVNWMRPRVDDLPRVE